MQKPCSVIDCHRDAACKGMCYIHHSRWKRHGDPLFLSRKPPTFDHPETCSVEGCNRTHYGRGFCNLHWRRWRKYGDPEKRLRAPAGSGSINAFGYRVRWRKGKLCQEHRLVWESIHGPIPSGYHIHHLNGDRLDNRVENLEIMSASAHGKLHSPSPYANERCIECGTPAVARDRCKRCYHRWWYHNLKKK